MRSFSHLAILALPFLGSVLCDPNPSPTAQIYADAHAAFQDLLNALPEESLHAALNGLTKYQPGIFESTRHGVERVHHDNPPLATKLIVAAVQDLKKRQTPPSNGTSVAPSIAQSSDVPSEPTSAAPEDSSDAPAPTTEVESAVIVPVPVTTTNADGETTVVSSVILSEPTASVAVAVTRTNEDGSTVVATETKPAVIFTATDAAGSRFVTTSTVNFAPTRGQVFTTTDAEGSTLLTTYTPGGGKVSSILLITTTGSDGKPSTITSYTVVGAGTATGTDGQPIPTDASSARPGLQTGAAMMNQVGGAVVVGGAVGGALVLWI